MSEDLRAHGVNLDYDPDKDPTATAGEAQAWKHGRDVGRAERDAEIRRLVDEHEDCDGCGLIDDLRALAPFEGSAGE